MTEKKRFPAKILFVYDATRFQLRLSLDFGVLIEKDVRLEGSREFPSPSSSFHQDILKAKAAKNLVIELSKNHCALADVSESRKNAWADIWVEGGFPNSKVEALKSDGKSYFHLREAIEAASEYGYSIEKMVRECQ